MNLNNYRTAAAATAMYPGAGQRTLLGLSYLALGLVGEVSEIGELVAKMRSQGEWVHLDDIRHELGDVLWYDAMLTAELGLSTSDDAVSSYPTPVAPVPPVPALLDLVQAAGQVAEVVKKAIRADGPVAPEKVAPALTEVRRLIALLGANYGTTVEEIRAANIAKLTARFKTGTIKVHT